MELVLGPYGLLNKLNSNVSVYSKIDPILNSRKFQIFSFSGNPKILKLLSSYSPLSILIEVFRKYDGKKHRGRRSHFIYPENMIFFMFQYYKQNNPNFSFWNSLQSCLNLSLAQDS